MAWNKGKQRYRTEFSAKEFNSYLRSFEGDLPDEEAKYLLYKFLRSNIALR